MVNIEAICSLSIRFTDCAC